MLPMADDRTTHWLKHNHGTRTPNNLMIVECVPQTCPHPDAQDKTINRLDFGVAQTLRLDTTDGGRVKQLVFNHKDQFWPFLFDRIRANTSLWLAGVEIAQAFTWLQGWQLIESRVFELQPQRNDTRSKNKDVQADLRDAGGWIVDGERVTVLLLYAKGAIVHVVDLRNYGCASVEEMAEAVGVKLRQQPEDRSDFAEWKWFMQRRVLAQRKYLEELIRFWRENDLGNWRHTIGSLAMGAYRHKFMDHRILIHDCEDVLHLEREALAGGEFRNWFCGRTSPSIPVQDGVKRRKPEYHQWRQGRVYQYDCNACYASVMRDNLYPRQFTGAWKAPADFDDYASWAKQHYCIARVELETVDEPYHCEVRGERYWAVGRFITTLAGPELARAVRDGHVRRFHALAAYYQESIFEGYVDFCNSMRLSAKAIRRAGWRAFAKLLPNALAGKFAQKSPLWDFTNIRDDPESYGIYPRKSLRDDRIHIYRSIAGYVQERVALQEANESVPVLTAAVCCYAREKMREIYRAVPRADRIYVANDAIYVLEGGVDALKPYLERTPGELGKLRLVKVWNECEFRGPHDYTRDGEDVIAGVSADADKSAWPEVTMTRQPTLRKILLHQPQGYCIVETITLKRPGWHPKGILNRDGSVDPPQWIEGELHFDRSHPLAYPQIPPDTRI